MKLISMTDFVLEQIPISTMTDVAQMKLCRRYADFLKQPLKLGMFIPCDEHDVPLKKPNQIYKKGAFTTGHNYTKEGFKYQQAKERVLFEGFEIKKYTKGNMLTKDGNSVCAVSDLRHFEIENILTHFEIEPTLTQSAIKIIGL